VCVLAGAGWADVIRAVTARSGRTAATALAVALALVALPFLIADVGSLRSNARQIRSEARFYDALPAAIAKAGGRDAVKRCAVYAGPYQVQALSWHLKMPSGQIGIVAHPPGILFAPRTSQLAHDARFRLLTTTRAWVVRRTCAA
jgi:hypothetical protein